MVGWGPLRKFVTMGETFAVSIWFVDFSQRDEVWGIAQTALSSYASSIRKLTKLVNLTLCLRP